MQFVYKKIKSTIKENIYEKLWEPGTKIPSSRNLADQFHCSVNTIERALNELSEEGLVVRENRKGTFVSDEVTIKRQSGLIGVMVLSVEHPSYGSIIRGIEDILHSSGYSLMVASDDQNINKLNTIVQDFISKKVEGVIMTPIVNKEKECLEIVNQLQEQGIKIVLFDRYLYNLNLPFVTSDNVRGSYRLTKMLIDQGHEKIAFIRSSELSSVKERWLGYEQALLDHGLKPINKLDINISQTKETLGNESLKKLKEELNNLDFTAIFSTNEHVAKLCISAMIGMGKRIPEDISLVTYDANIHHYIYPCQLTGVVQPFREMGQSAVKQLLKMIDGEADSSISGIICSSSLQIGESISTVAETEIMKRVVT